LSRFSILLAIGFLVLHTTGAHYTYSLVPYDDWAQALFGQTISDVTGWTRNEFDRLVHLAFGVLLASGCHDVLVRSGRAASGTAWWVTLLLAMAASHIYELIEWGAAEVFGGEMGAAYVGTQGDEWDAQKDMALATLGTIIGILIGMAHPDGRTKRTSSLSESSVLAPD
jgi:putative membrane protein